MNGLTRSLLMTSLLFFSGKLISQDNFHESDRIYGLDPLLYNGKKYAYFLPRGTGGNQFFSSPDFIKGDVVIKGQLFSGIPLNYDIYNQQVLIQYNEENGASEIIEISKAWLDSFHFGNAAFKCIVYDSEPRIYQVLGKGPYYILYYWRKDLKLDNSGVKAIYTFTQPMQSRYVLIDGKINPFGSKGSFINLFDPAHKLKIRNYIQDNSINLKKASGQTMENLINYISNLD